MPDRVIYCTGRLPGRSAPAAEPDGGVVSATETIAMAVIDERMDARSTEIGTGMLPIQDVIDTAAMLPQLDYMVLEQDRMILPELQSIGRSRKAFSLKFNGVKWPTSTRARSLVLRVGSLAAWQTGPPPSRTCMPSPRRCRTSA